MKKSQGVAGRAIVQLSLIDENVGVRGTPKYAMNLIHQIVALKLHA